MGKLQMCVWGGQRGEVRMRDIMKRFFSVSCWISKFTSPNRFHNTRLFHHSVPPASSSCALHSLTPWRTPVAPSRSTTPCGVRTTPQLGRLIKMQPICLSSCIMFCCTPPICLSGGVSLVPLSVHSSSARHLAEVSLSQAWHAPMSKTPPESVCYSCAARRAPCSCLDPGPKWTEP